ncbi:MAG TPA: YMGG-like glycine zipper-containing protein [Phenylobacterium sp.]|uniref:YMGG-like glycine zipper-containing protein n=1 Tax=Phenylobacterium sp. TaxID=1871053 RepID=UPI002CBA1AD3|nr:YMGG-like glycine zipper-containing protein [Phenylobacterium sp.]HSV01764.1 YMGG-like glycine zipper-containing protein [Phenylobacterium sp.]
MHALFKVGMASALALATAAPAMAQNYQNYQDYPRDEGYQSPPPQYQPTPQYQEDQQRYQEQQRAYESRRSDYDAHRADYAAARREYERRLADYNRARADYDARYGYGAYARLYGPAPVWDERYWAYYVTPAPAYGYAAPAAPYYGANTAYAAPAVRCDSSGTVTGGAIGALAGAVLGSQLSAPGRHTENSVLGAVVGGGLGAAVGHAHDRYRCDQRGPYFTYQETIPYREGRYVRSNRYAEYQRMGCRLAPAPVDTYGRDYRYVRVCPDAEGRYRIVA